MAILESIFGPLGVHFWPKSQFWASGSRFLVCGRWIWGLVGGFSFKKANIFLISRQAQTIKIYLILMCHSILYIILPVKMILRALFY